MARGEEFNTGLTATYRFQFHKDFPFAEGAKLAGYLRDLGISHVYASPIMQSKPGSLHGYDVTDFAVINPELGGEDGFRAARRDAEREEHRADHRHRAQSHGGRRWRQSLLARSFGERAGQRYADFFDVDFNAAGLQGKILTPFLGVSYSEALKWANSC